MKWKNNKSIVSSDGIKSLVKCFMVNLTFLNVKIRDGVLGKMGFDFLKVNL